MREDEEPYDLKGAPGSDEAISNGCLCPADENRHGEGRITNVKGEFVRIFTVSKLCPLHGGEPRKGSFPKED